MKPNTRSGRPASAKQARAADSDSNSVTNLIGGAGPVDATPAGKKSGVSAASLRSLNGSGGDATSIEGAGPVDAEPPGSKPSTKNIFLRSIQPQGLRQRAGQPRAPKSAPGQGGDLIWGKQIAPKTRVRVEPKSRFANERTFIQWMSAALLFITFSQLLYIFADQNEMGREASIAGTWMLAMSLFVAMYGLATYYRRIYLMQNGKPYGYADFVGPGILTASIVAGVILLIVFTHKQQPNKTAMQATDHRMVHQEGQCVRRSLEGVPGGSRISLVMELQPSGAVVDESRGLLLVPSQNRIIALPDGLPSDEENKEPARVVATVDGADMEGLEHVGDQVLALSEGDEAAEVITLEWTDEIAAGGQLREVHRSKLLPSTGRNGRVTEAEGMALVPGRDDASQDELVVAQESTIDVFSLDSFRIGAASVERKTTLNSRLLSRGLRKEYAEAGDVQKYTKVGDMQFFEGLLWVLFDNSRVIRGFDVRTGAMMQETPLPVAGAGSESQWEGMRLQRVAGARRGLRGGHALGDSGTTLVLHLALDTPAMVWSLRLDEGPNEGGARWTLPNCAVGLS